MFKQPTVYKERFPALRLIDTKNNYWILLEDFMLDEYTVPKGFITDLVSIPRIFWGIWPPFGEYLAASIVHDYLLKIKRKELGVVFIDDEFNRLMGLPNYKVNPLTRFLFYWIVTIFHFFTG